MNQKCLFEAPLRTLRSSSQTSAANAPMKPSSTPQQSQTFLLVDKCTGRGHRIDESSGAPLRLFFGLSSGESASALWRSAIRPKSARGGTGDCERLALLGDAVLKVHVLQELFQRMPDLGVTHVQQLCQAYISNATLPRLDDIFHLRTIVAAAQAEEPGGSAKYKMSEREVSTVLEALIGASREVNGDEFVRGVVVKIMGLLDGTQVPPFTCGDPLYSNWRGVTFGLVQGRVACCSLCPFALEDPRYAPSTRSLCHRPYRRGLNHSSF